MRIQKDQLVLVCNLEIVCHCFNILVELLQYVSCTLFWNLKNQALRSLNVESCNVHGSVARTDFYDIKSVAHALPFFVKHDPVFVENACLSIHNSARLCQFFSF